MIIIMFIFEELLNNNENMNCINHGYRAAVVGCARCGVGMCQECLSEVVSSYDNRPLCHDCSQAMAQAELLRAQKSRGWSIA